MKDLKKEAKLSVLSDLRKQMSDLMGEGLKGGLNAKRKVVVAADTEEGLKEGLEKAEELLPGDESEEEIVESEESEADESEEDIEAQIQALMAKKAALKK